MIKNFRHEGRSLYGLPFVVHTDKIYPNGLFNNQHDPENSEYAAKISWYNVTNEPLWLKRSDPAYYAPLNTVAVMYKQTTIDAINKHFNVDIQI